MQPWPEVIRELEAGRLRKRYEATYERPYDLDPAPRRDLLPKASFLTTTSLIATRGCHNRCGFCYLSTDGLQMPYRVRSPADIRRQFREDGEPYAVFVDNNLGSKPEYLRALCRELRPLRRIWSAAVSLDVTDDPSLVREMALAGCTGVFIGFESLSDGNLAAARKRTPRTEDYAARVRLLHRNWELYDTAHVVFQPRHLTPEELAAGYDWLYRKLFSHASIWRRRPADASAIPAYLAMSYLYKRSNRFWHFLITHRLVHAAWSPLVHWTRLRHLAFRARLQRTTDRSPLPTMRPAGHVVSAGV